MSWADGSYLEVVGGDDASVITGTRDGDAPPDPETYDAIEEGWRAFLLQLRFWIEQRPGGRRRPLYLTGETTPRQAKSLVEGEWSAFGPRVASTVDPDGHLVVLSGRAPLTSGSATHTELIVSTYGLDDA